jgi:Arm DNA-binding domain/Phage integrase central domain
MLSLGTYPDTPLIEARKQRETARQQLAQGVNPAAERQRKRNPIDRSFEGVARDWLGCVLKLVLAGKRSRDTYEKAKNQLESYIIAGLGREDVNSRRPSQLLPVLKRIEAKGLLETAITDPAAVGALLCKIDRYAGRTLTRLAFKLSPLVFVRPHNLP